MGVTSKIFSFLTGQGGFVSKLLDKIVVDKDKRLALQLEAEQLLAASLQEQEEQFRQWVLEYEGAAKDIPRWVLSLRSTVRPFLTYALAGLWMWAHIYMYTQTDLGKDRIEYMTDMADLLFKLNILSLGFWYGERLLTRSGLVDLFKKGQ